MPGMTTSTTRSCGEQRSKKRHASSPSTASSTVNPSFSKAARASDRKIASSSTMRIGLLASGGGFISPSYQFLELLGGSGKFRVERRDEILDCIDALLARAGLDIGAMLRQELGAQRTGAGFEAVRASPNSLGIARCKFFPDGRDERRRGREEFRDHAFQQCIAAFAVHGADGGNRGRVDRGRYRLVGRLGLRRRLTLERPDPAAQRADYLGLVKGLGEKIIHAGGETALMDVGQRMRRQCDDRNSCRLAALGFLQRFELPDALRRLDAV